MPRKLAATQENNAWRSRKRVVADYVPECMHHHANDKAVVRHWPTPAAWRYSPQSFALVSALGRDQLKKSKAAVCRSYMAPAILMVPLLSRSASTALFLRTFSIVIWTFVRATASTKS